MQNKRYTWEKESRAEGEGDRNRGREGKKTGQRRAAGGHSCHQWQRVLVGEVKMKACGQRLAPRPRLNPPPCPPALALGGGLCVCVCGGWFLFFPGVGVCGGGVNPRGIRHAQVSHRCSHTRCIFQWYHHGAEEEARRAPPCSLGKSSWWLVAPNKECGPGFRFGEVENYAK